MNINEVDYLLYHPFSQNSFQRETKSKETKCIFSTESVDNAKGQTTEL